MHTRTPVMPGLEGQAALNETPDLRPETAAQDSNLAESSGAVSPKRSPPSRFSRELRQVTEVDEFDDIDLTEPVSPPPATSLKRKPRSRPNSYLGFQSVVNSFAKKPDFSILSKSSPKPPRMESIIASPIQSPIQSPQLHTDSQFRESPEETVPKSEQNDTKPPSGQNHEQINTGTEEFNANTSQESLPIPPKSPNRLSSSRLFKPRTGTVSPPSSSHASPLASPLASPSTPGKPPSPLRKVWSPVFNPEELALKDNLQKEETSTTPVTPPIGGGHDYKSNAVLQTPVTWNRSPIRLPLSTEHMDPTHRILFNDPGSRFGSPRDSPKHSPRIISSHSKQLSSSSLNHVTSATETGSEAGSLAFEGVEEYVQETQQLNNEDWEHDGASFDVEPVRGDLSDQIEAMKSEMNFSMSESMLMFPESVYRTPLPPTLLRPPILSKREEPPVHMRNAFKRLKLPPKPEWGPSPLEPVQTDPYSEAADEDGVDSDGSFSSDGATILSDEEELERDHELIDEENADKESTTKKKKWLRRLFKSKAEYKNMEEAEEGGAGSAENDLEQEQMLEFSRLNLENVQNQAEILGLGAGHAVSSNPDEVPSLVEEIEIRKRARKLQRDVLNRDVGRIDILRDLNPSWHPMAETAVPTLMQLQSMATEEYKSRQSWMSKALQGVETGQKPNFENQETNSSKRPPSMIMETSTVSNLRISNPKNDTETLAQRRAKLKLSKETLSERRERIRREKQQQQSQDTQSAVECG